MPNAQIQWFHVFVKSSYAPKVLNKKIFGLWQLEPSYGCSSIEFDDLYVGFPAALHADLLLLNNNF